MDSQVPWEEFPLRTERTVANGVLDGWRDEWVEEWMPQVENMYVKW
jgi:hypothetical protein